MAVKDKKRNFTCLWADFKPTEEDIEQILADHTVWLQGRSEGEPPHDLAKIDFSDADLEEAKLYRADLRGAALNDANLKGASLNDANLEKASLNWTNLELGWLDGANMKGAELIGTNLEDATISNADLEGASLHWANLKEAELYGANLKGTRLWGADLSRAHVQDVSYNRRTKCKGINVETCYGNPMFKRFAQDQDFLEELQERKWGKFKWGKYLYWLWLIVADCGRTPWYWMAWSLFFVFGFAALFTTWDPAWPIKLKDTLVSATAPSPISFWTAFYFSIVTFTTLGFGDIVAASQAARFWVGLEVVIGYIMLGGLISILANKLARRS